MGNLPIYQEAIMRMLALGSAAMLLLGACEAVQTTSGADYLARYEPVKSQPQPVVQRTVRRMQSGTEVVEGRVQTVSTDDLVRNAAAIEPLLKLPARIGLARIENGALTAIPAAESQLWRELGERHAGLGSLATLDPFLAEYTVETVLPQDRRALRRDAFDLITAIRLGAARQHMDAVLIYEIGSRGHRIEGVEGLSPIRVLGQAPLPAAPIEKEGVARAFLMDVRNGYPYGAASASVDLSPLERSFWDDRPEDEMGIEAKALIAQNLMPEVEKMVGALTGALLARNRRVPAS
jgi:hypothetical protein